jgi:hypothetical protein
MAGIGTVVYGDFFTNEGRRQRAFDRALEKTLRDGIFTVRDRTPVRTGNLRSQWMEDGDSIFNDVGYAPHVEYGTRRMEGRFMLTSSIPMIEDEFVNNILNELDNI